MDKIAAEESLIKEIQELELGRWRQGFKFLVNSFTVHFIFHQINNKDYLNELNWWSAVMNSCSSANRHILWLHFDLWTAAYNRNTSF